MSNWKNVNNWHWVNKNCINWTQTYFTEHLVGLEAEKNGIKAKITRMEECTGDVDLNQRKGKIITIYDVQLKLAWEGSTPDGTTATGKIVIPEVAHDTDVDDYVFDVSVDNDNSAKQPIRDVVKKELTPLIRKRFSVFSADLVKHHGADVYIETDKLGQPAAPKVATPVVKENTVVNSASTKTSTKSEKSDKSSPQKVNTTELSDTIEFQTSAIDLYETLLDIERVRYWTRGPAKISKEVGSEFELFNGNVTGKLLEAEPGKKIVQLWRLSSWPAGHYSTVTMVFDQGRDYVKLQIKQTGVPVGEEELTQRNWSGYYWRSIKQSFGYGAVF